MVNTDIHTAFDKTTSDIEKIKMVFILIHNQPNPKEYDSVLNILRSACVEIGYTRYKLLQDNKGT